MNYIIDIQKNIMHEVAYYLDSNLVVLIEIRCELVFRVYFAISPMKIDTNYSPPNTGDDANTVLACLKRVTC